MKKVAVCDIDGVIVKNETQFLLLAYLFSKRKIPAIVFFRILLWFLFYKLHMTKDIKQVRSLAYRVFAGWTEAELADMCREFVKRKVLRHIRHDLVTRIKNLADSGYEIIFASATLFEIVVPIRDFIGFGHIIATRLESVSGVITGNIQGEAVYGSEKLIAVERLLIEKRLPWGGSWAFSDHISDLPLLCKVEHPVVVDAGAQLKKYARLRNWEIW